MSDPSSDEPISWFPVPDEADLPPDLQKLFAKARATLGFVPNVFRAYGYCRSGSAPGSAITASCTSGPSTSTSRSAR